VLFMVIERFKDADPLPVYRHLRDRGRGLPDGLRYVDSWVEPGFGRCFQVMECDDLTLLQHWAAEWSDLIEFEIIPVTLGKDTGAALAHSAP
jgi:Protein of unknown function (DUF3303)